MEGVSGGGPQGSSFDSPGVPDAVRAGATCAAAADAPGDSGTFHGSEKVRIPADDSIGAPDAEHRRIPDLGAVGDSKSSSGTYSRRKIAPNKQVIQPTIADLLAGKKRSAGGGSQKDAPAAVPSPTSSDDFMATAKKRLADQAPFSCSKRTPHAGVRGGQVGLHVPNAPTAGPSVGTRKRGPRKVRFQVVQACVPVRRFFRFTVLLLQ